MTESGPQSIGGGALAGLRVLEISHQAGAVCGRVLADLGADVVKLEPPGGEAARRAPPTIRAAGGEAISAFWLAFNLNKASVCVELDTAEGLARFRAMARDADIVVTDWERCPVADMDRLAAVARAANPALVWVEILPFGRGGPYEGYPATDTVLQALGGHLFLNGDIDRPPVRISAPVGLVQGGAEAASAALMAYYHRMRTGEGQRVDVSIQACIVWTLLNSTMIAQILGFNESRGGAVRRERANRFYTRLVWDTRDGHVYFGPVGGGGGAAREKSYASLLKWMREDGFVDPILTAHDWNGDGQFAIPQAEYDAVTAVIARFVATRSTDELMARAVAERILLAPVSSIADVFRNPHFRARGVYQRVDDPARGLALDVPGRWANLSGTPLVAPRPAPAVPITASAP